MSVDCFALYSKGEERRLGDVGGRRGRSMEDPQVAGSASCCAVVSRDRECRRQSRFRGKTRVLFGHVELEIPGDRHS